MIAAAVAAISTALARFDKPNRVVPSLVLRPNITDLRTAVLISAPKVTGCVQSKPADGEQ
jgi:hypothetical protein